jgi:hypothetical protein
VPDEPLVEPGLMLGATGAVLARLFALFLALGVVEAAHLANVVSRPLQSSVSDKVEPPGRSADAVNEIGIGGHGRRLSS